MIMSSFLMNSGSYVDPKFPPNEEYSQSSYIPSHGHGGAEYYGHHHPHHHPHHLPHQPAATYQGYAAIGASAPAYGRDTTTSYANNHHVPGSFYQGSCPMSAGMSAAMGPQQGSMGSGLGGTGLGGLAGLDVDSAAAVHHRRTPPQQQPPPHGPQQVPQAVSVPGGGHGHVVPPPQQQQQPPLVVPPISASTTVENGIKQDNLQECNTTSNNSHPIIYPWMRKVHISNPGKSVFLPSL